VKLTNYVTSPLYFPQTTNYKLTVNGNCELSYTEGPGFFEVSNLASESKYGSFESFTVNGYNCGLIDYSVTILSYTSESTITSFSVDASTNSFIAYSSKLDQVGAYKAKLTASLHDQPYNTLSVVFSFAVRECAVT
jgi:hypothetical protein